MGACLEESEVMIDKRKIPLSIITKVKKSIFRIIKNGEEPQHKPGFFMTASDSLKYLVTNYSYMNPDEIDGDFEIEIWNKKRIKLNINSINIIYFEKPMDIAIVEIKDTNEIYKDIEFLDYDDNYIKNGYEIYKDMDTFSVYPFAKNEVYTIWKTGEIRDCRFTSNLITGVEIAGCPIVLLNNNKNKMKVIGLQMRASINVFIGEINKYLDSKNQNFIIAELDIKDKDINKDIRIICSYEESVRNSRFSKGVFEEELKNEEEIKKCEIEINNELIPFNYTHTFNKKGKYIIKYSFKNKLTNANYLFYQCKAFIKLNLSNFKTKDVKDMSYMFMGCSSLAYINLSNFETQNVINMRNLFSFCESLKNINLLSFNTEKTTNMIGLFSECRSLTNINLSSFNTKNVINMAHMFKGCESLKNIKISSFNTENVSDMSELFKRCESLKEINLSNFNTQNVTDLSQMFSGCKSLKEINLSNFNTQKVSDMKDMFSECKSLKKENIIANDSKILQEIEKELK